MEISRLTFFPRHTRFTVRFPHRLYSSQVPRIAERLLRTLPSLAEHRCQNRHGLPFVEELEDSELGHVFEHVVLELLADRGIYTRGQTTWNWDRDPIGTYQITVSTGKRHAVKESLLLAQAVFTNLLIGPPLDLRPAVGTRREQTARPTSITGGKRVTQPAALFSFPAAVAGGRAVASREVPKSPAGAGPLGGEVKLRRQVP